MTPLPFAPDALDDFLAVPTDGVIATLQRHDADILVAGAGGKMGGTLCLMLAAAMKRAGLNRKVIAVSRFSSVVLPALYRPHTALL